MNANQTVLNDFISKHPFAAVQSLELVPDEKVASFFQTIPLNKCTTLFSLMKKERAAVVLVLLPTIRAKDLIENVDIPYIASVLKHVDTPIKNKLLDALSPEKQTSIKRQLAFLPDTVAAVMEPAMVVTNQMELSDVLELVKRSEEKEEFYVYVVDVEGVFEGRIRLKELLLADPTDSIASLLIKNVPNFLSDMLIKSVVDHPVWITFQEIPILDPAGKILGRLPYRNTLKFTHKPSKNLSNEIAETGSALGELYRIGLTGLLQGGEK